MSTIKEKMIEFLKKDSKREYLEICRQNYTQAVSVAQELFPEFYGWKTDPFDNLYDKAMENKKRGNIDEEIQILESAIANRSLMPYCYERLAILYSKANNYKQAYDVCMKWFDAGFWKVPNSATTSLHLLDRLEKLKKKIYSA